MGNHDFISENTPFFGFLDDKTQDRNLTFVTKPTEIVVQGSSALFLPCTRTWEKAYGKLDFKPFKFIFCHQTFDGAIAENGIGLRGINPGIFSGSSARIYAGDIHVPQKVNKQIEYVGSPYHVRFGDTFKARVILLEGKAKDLYFPFRGREVIIIRNLDDLSKKDFILGTQVKIKVRLKRSEFPEWPILRKEIKALVGRKGWELCGLSLEKMKTKDRVVEDEETIHTAGTPEDILETYAKKKKLNKRMVQAGKMFIEEAMK